MSETHLTSREYWAAQWSERRAAGLGFDPETREFRELHALFRRHLQPGGNTRFLEIGAYPGNYLWYFHRYFEFRVSGLEYLEQGCREAQRQLDDAGVEAEMIHADLFDYEVEPHDRWDVVASFGFVEHFTDPSEAIQRHLDLLEPGGTLILVIPNHHGVNGRLMGLVDRQKLRSHNLMSAEDLQAAVRLCGGVEILEAGYYGRLAFRNSGLYTKLRQGPRPIYTAVRGTLWLVEGAGQAVLPNTSWLSPHAALVARKN